MGKIKDELTKSEELKMDGLLFKAADNKLVSLLRKQLKGALEESERLYQENVILKEKLRRLSDDSN